MARYRLLLDMVAERGDLGDGYWYKIEASDVDVSEERPGGVRYSLTLHDNNNVRIFGIDNAHALKVMQGRTGTGKRSFDHVHEGSLVYSYKYTSEENLIKYFFEAVYRIMSAMKE